MIEEHIPRKCTRCEREHNAPGNICFLCMKTVLGQATEENVSKVPKRVGIAQKGDLVILETVKPQTEDDKCRVANLLAEVREETGIRFMVLDAQIIKLARIADENDQKELTAWREKWKLFFYEPKLNRIVTRGEDGELLE